MRNSLRKLRVAWLYPLPKKKLLAAYLRGEEPDKLSGIEYIKHFSIIPVLIDPYKFPLNPFISWHSLYSGFDILRSLRILLTLNEYDVVLSVGESSALLLLLLRRIIGSKRPVLIWDPALDFQWKMRKKVLEMVLPKADKVLLVGTNQKRFLEQRYGSKCKTEVIYHWVDSDFYRPYDKNTGNYIFSIGNDISRDFQTLINAVNGLSLKSIIKTDKHGLKEHALQSNITCFNERVPYTELRDLYANSMFVIIPLHNSLHAGGVNSILESMAMGKATIVSDSEGIKDFVRDGETAIMVKPGDSDELRNAAIYLANNPKEAERIGRNARRTVEERFSLSKFAERLAREIWTTYNSFHK